MIGTEAPERRASVWHLLLYHWESTSALVQQPFQFTGRCTTIRYPGRRWPIQEPSYSRLQVGGDE